MNPRLIVLGSTTLDRFLKIDDQEARVIHAADKSRSQICFNYADKIPVADYHETLGGNGANVAVGSARLGCESGIWTIMGDDSVSHTAHAVFSREGIDTTYFQINKDIPSTVSTVLHYKTDRTIFIYGKPHPCKLPDIKGYSWGYITTMPEVSETMLSDIVSWSRKEKVNLIFQPGTMQLRLGAEKTKDLLSVTKIFIVNKEEAEEFTGVSGKIADTIKAIHSYGVSLVIVTDAEKGAYVSDGITLFFAGVEDISVIEKTGAGDGYASGFCSAFLQGNDIPTSMKWGLLNAQSVISHIGPQAGVLHSHQMQALIASGRPHISIHEAKLED